ncbi:MAG: Asr1405/Asl0597 family protein, partial [Cyanobacteria bacterium J06635_10]
MKSFDLQSQTKHVVEVSWADRWQVYRRLKELHIPCWCSTNQPLTVEITHTAAAI